ncbi:ATP-binding protein [Embleya sp. NBC_00888]|uniref:ATP-binding protein n=1 Tax=Embleya sp. NBC_00888 TaxID=2975960 RepID=UPI003864B7B7
MTSAPAPQLDLPRDTVVTKAARAYVLDVCTALGVDRTTEGHANWLDDVLVVATELVTNAWRHTTGEIAVHWWVDGPTLMFGVTDTRFVELIWTCDLDAVPAEGEAGRGLGIVANLADHLAYGPIRNDGHDGKWVAAGFTLPGALHAVHRRRAAGNRPAWHRDRSVTGLGGPEGSESPIKGCTSPYRAIRAALRLLAVQTSAGVVRGVARAMCRSRTGSSSSAALTPRPQRVPAAD